GLESKKRGWPKVICRLRTLNRLKMDCIFLVW
ncbi:MAG: hypothetical protein ACI8TV_001220, partial [Porticoccaceae bacterium]